MAELKRKLDLQQKKIRKLEQQLESVLGGHVIDLQCKAVLSGSLGGLCSLTPLRAVVGGGGVTTPPKSLRVLYPPLLLVAVFHLLQCTGAVKSNGNVVLYIYRNFFLWQLPGCIGVHLT